MNNQQSAIALIKSLSGQANILTIPRVYISILDGDINAALLLNQIIYWSDRHNHLDGWFYKSYDDWEEEIGFTQFMTKRAVEKIKKLGLIETKLKKANNAPTIHYRLDFGLLTNLIIKKVANGQLSLLTMDYEESSETDNEETSQSLTETTTENTTENTTEEEEATTPFSKLSIAFVNKTQIPELTGGAKRWIESINRMVKAGVEPEDIITAVDELSNKNYTIIGIASVENAAISVMSKRKSKNGKHKDRDPKSYISGEFAEFIEH